MKRSTLVTVVAAVAALAALLAWAFAPRPLEVETATAAFGPFEQTVDEDGRTRLVERYVVSAPLAGRLQRLALREGDAVQAGDVVAMLLPAISPMLDARTRGELAARAAAAEAALAQAGSRVAAGRVALERARSEQQRSEQLAAQGFVAPTKIDADRLAVRAAASELEAAVQGQHVARHDLEQARAALGASAAGAAAQGFALRSPVAGRVLRRHLTSEAMVAAGAPVLEVGDTARLEVVTELLTTDALAAVPGAPVRIERWGGPGVLEGRVARIEPAAFTKVSALGVEEQRVLAVIELASPRERWAALGDGFRVAVRIVTRSEPRVLKLPVSAVFPRPGAVAGTSAADGGHAVFVVDGGRARLQPVAMAARNGQEAWIASGLAEGAVVVVYPPAELADGARVKPRRV